MNNLFKNLIKTADTLDVLGKTKDADLIDWLLFKIAMSIEDARMLLSVPNTATEDAIQKAWQQKALENHPDRGGDTEKMKAINVARDVLLGQSKPDSPMQEPARTYRQTERPRVEKIVTLDEALESVNIPGDVEWKFITESGYGQNLSGRQHGQVIYGVTKETHVFVGLYNYKYDNMFENRHIDKWDVFLRQMPIDASLSSIAPQIIRDLWAKFDDVKQYNAKVKILGPGWTIRAALYSHSGRSVSFKDAMALMGESIPVAWEGRKIKIIMEMGPEDYTAPRPITIVVNGSPYELSKESCKIAKKGRLPTFVFGTYVYSESKKDLTKIPKEKAAKVFQFMIKHMTPHEPKELMDAIEKALQQVTK